MKNKINNVSKNSLNSEKNPLLELDSKSLRNVNGGHCSPLRKVHYSRYIYFF